MSFFKKIMGSNNVNSTKIRQLDEVNPANELDSYSQTRFTLFKATGGIVISTAKFKAEGPYEPSTNLYIITDEMDLGKELAKIITLDSLKR